MIPTWAALQEPWEILKAPLTSAPSRPPGAAVMLGFHSSCPKNEHEG